MAPHPLRRAYRAAQRAPPHRPNPANTPNFPQVTRKMSPRRAGGEKPNPPPGT
ncbi:hypothetical protein GCM10022214_74180 [Actinomadura miaoliensis]|uniref:Uncharacterized protein n=1 Tax=Actinomadura miaoliensis TaxID=430685 RepID=A0ABP7WXR3_9ACTN